MGRRDLICPWPLAKGALLEHSESFGIHQACPCLLRLSKYSAACEGLPPLLCSACLLTASSNPIPSNDCRAASGPALHHDASNQQMHHPVVDLKLGKLDLSWSRNSLAGTPWKPLNVASSHVTCEWHCRLAHASTHKAMICCLIWGSGSLLNESQNCAMEAINATTPSL